MSGKSLNNFNLNDMLLEAKKIIWIKLEVLNSKLTNKNKGFVEFKAYYIEHSQNHVLHEISEFHRKNGIWFYVDGLFLS